MPPRTTGRAGKVRRKTKEVDVQVQLKVDGRGKASADTGIPFFDHMLEQLGKHAGFDLTVTANGDLKVDAHHTVEDTGLAVGDVLRKSLAGKQGIARFGDALVPLDEALIQVALDLSSRPYLSYDVDAKTKVIGTFDTRLAEEFIRAFAQAAGATIHVRMLSGKDPHHIVEATFKALAQALRKACARSRASGVPSTKGKL
ncbi:MAG: imidazoleglycerol-phosphate dehydratase HisB [Actinomycetota bacterium]